MNHITKTHRRFRCLRCLGLAQPDTASASTRSKCVTRQRKSAIWTSSTAKPGRKTPPRFKLLHVSTSLQMFRNLIPALADKYHLVAPDYPGYGQSSMPPHDKFTYTFDNLADVIDKFTEKLGLKKYAIYVQDYGAPVGYRMAAKHPDRITAIVVQNGNAYDEGLDNDFWKPIKAYWKEPKSKEKRDALRKLVTYDATKWQYTKARKTPSSSAPTAQPKISSCSIAKATTKFKSTVPHLRQQPASLPSWQEYFRKHRSSMLIVWGKNDKIFPPVGAEPYKRDLKTVDYHLIDAGHFALETNGDEIAGLMREFLAKHVDAK